MTHRCMAGLLLAATAAGVCAQGYPDKPMRIIVPFAPGGGTDVLGRMIAAKLQESWGQPVLVDNRPGAGTVIGVAAAAKAAPDGHTLVMVTPSFIINATGVKKLPYDSTRDLAPVTLFASSPLLLVAHPSLPARTVRDLIGLARARPGQIDYASAGTGSPTHLGMEIFRGAGAVMNHVPYKGAGPAMVDLVGGRVQVLMTTLAFVKPHVDARKLNALGVSTARRSASMPAVPAIAETLPGYEVLNWWGVLTPAQTPTAIVAKLSTALGAMLRDSDVQRTLAREGIEGAGTTPEHFGAYLRAEIAKWAQVVRDTGVTLD